MDKALREAYEHSPVRTNLLNWYAFKKGAVVFLPEEPVESLATFIREHAATVHIGEGEKDGVFRNKDVNALEDHRYDYVICIEDIFSGKRMDLSTKVLTSYHEILKPGGKLIIAVNNVLGLRYFSGVTEEHTKTAFGAIEGIEDVDGNTGVTRDELLNNLKEAGFHAPVFYYPMPDFVFPTEIFSDKHLPKPGDITGVGREYIDEEKGVMSFSEEQVWMRICKTGRFPAFANSFLVFAERKA